MDPVTAIRTTPDITARKQSGLRHVPPEATLLGHKGWSCGSVEAVSTGATARSVWVVDGEALLLDGVGEVDRGTLEVGGAHPVDDDPDTVEVAHQVTVER